MDLVERFFFDIYNDEDVADPEGIELPDSAAAMARAVEEARVLAAESVRRGHLVGSHRVEVRDAKGNRVGAVRFDEAVRIS